MQKRNFILLLAALVAASFSTGCSSVSSTAKRSAMVAAGTGAGAAIAYKLSDGNPTTTALGAVGGALVTSLAQGEDSETLQKGFDQGYVQGQSDAIKRQYFLRQALEQKPAVSSEAEEVVYVVPGPEVVADGTKLAPHKVAVKVAE